MEKRIINHKGLDITMNIDVDSLKKRIEEPYKKAFVTLKKMVLSRERHIKKLHKQIKDVNNTMFCLYAGGKISYAISKKVNVKRMIILSYMNQTEYANPDIITSYMKRSGIGGTFRQIDIRFLVDKGYIQRAGDSPFYFITLEGREKVKEVAEIFKNAFEYFLDNNKIHIRKNVNKRGKKLRKPCFTEEQKNERSLFYRKMMRPFWDNDMKKIPKERSRRAEVLRDWIEEKKMNSIEVDEYYFKCLEKWSV